MDMKSLIKELSTNKDIMSYSEDAIKQSVVLRFFHVLGWNIFSILEVTPEFTLHSKKVDYALQYDSKPLVFVEAKRPSIALDDCQEQLLSYSFLAGVRLAVLTNGVNWWFYLPLQEGSWDKRKYFSINIFDQEVEAIERRFSDFLSKENVVSGYSEKQAKQVLKGKWRAKSISAGLPKAWNALISEPDEILIELLRDKVEDISGFTPTADELMNFMTNISEVSIEAKEDASIQVTKTNRQNKSKKKFSPSIDTRGRDVTKVEIRQEKMFHEIIHALQQLNGRATKARVEEIIYKKFQQEFEKEPYQEIVAHGVPRWQHNIAWAKEKLKHEGLIKSPSESGRGVWELTDVGKKVR